MHKKEYMGESKMKNKKTRLKIALLSCCFVTASLNAISGNIPEMAKTFATVPLYVVEFITTIPSLFQMLAILAGTWISRKVGYKHTALIGTALCAFTGIAPIFIENIYFILFMRSIFGFGAGLVTTTLLTLIIYFFEGSERSTMIGLQGSIGGLGSLITTFIAGKLLTYGWNISFSTYAIAFIVFGIVAVFVPNVKQMTVTSDDIIEHKKISFDSIVFLMGYAVLMFLSVSLATMFVIKCSTLMTMQGYGNSQDGSTIIMLISMGSLLSGAMYGTIVTKIKKLSLPLFYVFMAIAYFMASISNHLFITMISGFIHGFGFMAFVPYLQDIVQIHFHQHKEVSTSIILVAQCLGAFFTPYLGNILNLYIPSITGLLLACSIMYVLLVFISLLLVKQKNDSIELTESIE